MNSLNTNIEQPEWYQRSMEKEKLDQDESKRELDNMLDHIAEYEEFYYSLFAEHAGKTSYGFNEEERMEILTIAGQLRECLKEIVLENKIKILPNNHLDHLIGNSTMVFAGGKAKRYEAGKKIEIKDAALVKNQMMRLNNFIQEALKDKKLTEKELTSRVGYLEDFLQYLSCDLPNTERQLLLFKFFRELELGKMKQDDFWERAEELSEFIDVEKLREDITEDKMFGTYKLKALNKKNIEGETIH